MKNLLYILMLSNVLVIGSEQGRVFTKDTCNIIFSGKRLLTDKQREKYSECRLSRLEVYDKDAKEYIAHIAYKPSKCSIKYLHVDKKYRKKGIGSELTKRAIEDMRANHNCREVFLLSLEKAEVFWEKLGAEERDLKHVFAFPASNVS